MRLWPLIVVGALTFATIGFVVGAQWDEMRENDASMDDARLSGLEGTIRDLDDSGRLFDALYRREAVSIAAATIVVEDVLAWADEAAADNDALTQLIGICEDLPPPPIVLTRPLDDGVSVRKDADPPIHQFCIEATYDVRQQSVEDWRRYARLTLVVDEPSSPYPSPDALADAYAGRFESWSDRALQAREQHLGYIERLCPRIASERFTGELGASQQQASREMTALCEDVRIGSAGTVEQVARRIRANIHSEY